MQKSMLAAMALIAVAATGCAAGSGASGSKDDPVKIGQLALLSGPFGPLGQLTVAGQRVAFDEANADGGVCGRKIEAVTKDAGASSETALAAFNALKGEDVVGLSLVQGAQPVNVVLPEVEKLDMLAVPTTWGASLLASKNYMMVGTTYQRQAIGAIDWLVGKKLLGSGDAIGVAYLSGAYGGAVLAGIEHGAKVNGITVTSASVEPTATDMSGIVSNFHSKKVKAIFLAGTPDQTSSTVSVASARGLSIPVVTVSAGFSPGLLSTSAKAGLEKSLYVVGAWRGADASDNPAIAALAGKLKAIDQKAKVDRNVVNGYGDAVAFINIMKAACKNGALTAKAVTEALGKMNDLDTGGVFPSQDYTNRKVSPSDVVYLFRADSSVPGGLKQVSDEYTGPSQSSYTDDLNPIS